MTKERIAFIYGGRTGEHEISKLTARSVVGHIDKDLIEPLLVGIDEEGQAWLNQYDDIVTDNPALAIRSEHSQPIDLNEIDCECVFPVIHGTYYEDGCLQGLLELKSVPYVGAGVVASSVAMDKELAKRIAASFDIPIVPFQTIYWHMWRDAAAKVIDNLCAEFSFPVMVKPARTGSSVGISKAHSRDDLKQALHNAFSFDDKVLVEKAVDAREIECAVKGNMDNLQVSVPGEIIIHNKYDFYDYHAKYHDPDSLQLQIPAKLDDDKTKQVRKLAKAICQALNCEGLARVDFLLCNETGTFYFNELNTLPGFTTMSMYPLLWDATGTPYSKLINELIGFAKQRFQRQSQLQRVYHHESK